MCLLLYPFRSCQASQLCSDDVGLSLWGFHDVNSLNLYHCDLLWVWISTPLPANNSILTDFCQAQEHNSISYDPLTSFFSTRYIPYIIYHHKLHQLQLYFSIECLYFTYLAGELLSSFVNTSKGAFSDKLQHMIIFHCWNEYVALKLWN